MMRKLIGTAALSALLFAVSGCSHDCSTYCNKWQDCIDANLDVGRCEDACEAHAAASDSNADGVGDCAVCIDRNDKCSEVGGACFTQCVGIPRS